MTKSVALFLVIAAVLVAPPASAQNCPGNGDEPTFHAIGSYGWWDYSPDAECVSHTTYNMDPTTLWCYNEDAWEIVSNNSMGRVEYEFIGDPGYENWEASSRIEFNDPNNSASNWIEMYVGVQYNSPSPTWTQLWYHDGTMGDLSCSKEGGHFEAPEGAKISYVVEAYRTNSNVTIEIGSPIILSTSN